MRMLNEEMGLSHRNAVWISNSPKHWGMWFTPTLNRTDTCERPSLTQEMGKAPLGRLSSGLGSGPLPHKPQAHELGPEQSSQQSWAAWGAGTGGEACWF